ncbi:MAG: DUF3365 domain-containing protein [Rhizobiales bacterium]|nr:DUF3365 domain-containing protein [Hyphomicrobiales bacterium]
MSGGLANKLLVPVPVLLIICLALAWFFVPQSMLELVRANSVQSAVQTVNQFKTVRAYYTENVIKKVVANGGVRPSVNHGREADGIPPPATFLLDLSTLLEDRDTKIGLYSGFPFAGRRDRVLDDFQQEAWAALSANPDAVFSKQQSIDGQTVVRVAIADRMTAEACVSCHNRHPNSPKTDWKLDDVRGVLEVVSNITAPVAAARALSNQILLYGGLVALVVIAVSIYFSRYITGALTGAIAAMGQLAEEGADSTVEIGGLTRRDEFGAMARSLRIFKDNAIEKDRLERARADERAAREAERAAVEEHNRRLQRDIDATVQAAANGDFSGRMDSSIYHGSMKDVCDGLNQLLDTVDSGVSETVEVLAGMARGDLTRRMTGHYQGSFLRLKNDANTMAEQIASIAERIAEVGSAVDQSTFEITAGVGDLSTRTEHQAASLEENTASMEELSATVKQNADNAQEANRVAVEARLAAANGGEVVHEAVQAMSRIEGSSRRITDIVGLIEEIAFQTNLLALNAAVEAARAGDAGKGFAVVANEVRGLAQRSADASKDIKDLISKSDDQVREGVELVNKAGASLGDILNSVKKVADFVSEIATASQEQSGGIDQVSRAINSMEAMTQQNGALVEETTAALQSAQAQVGDLREAVGFFRTGREAMPSADADETGDNGVYERQTAVRP